VSRTLSKKGAYGAKRAAAVWVVLHAICSTETITSHGHEDICQGTQTVRGTITAASQPHILAPSNLISSHPLQYILSLRVIPLNRRVYFINYKLSSPAVLARAVIIFRLLYVYYGKQPACVYRNILYHVMKAAAAAGVGGKKAGVENAWLPTRLFGCAVIFLAHYC